MERFAPEETHVPEPWFTGTLLGNTSVVVPGGNILFQPYLFAFDQFGRYDSHWKAHSTPDKVSVIPLFFSQIGITKRIELQLIAQVVYAHQQGKSATNVGDLSLGFDFQLLEGKQNSWSPGIVISLVERFPTGKYQKLNPKKHGVDSSGDGDYTTLFSSIFSWIYHLKAYHFLHTYITLQYAIPTSVHVRGFNTYGGGFETNGRVRAGNVFGALLSLEYAFTRNWAFALDVTSLFQNKTTFSGRPGFDAAGNRAVVGSPSQAQFSLAPAIEYNFSSTSGLVAGPIFTIAGRNSTQFAGAAISYYCFYSLPKNKK